MADPTPLLSALNVRKSFLERVILDSVSLTLHEGERLALLGANGAGKSTLFSILAGSMKPDEGEVRRRKDLTVAVLDQGGNLREDWTVGQNLEAAFADVRELEAELDQVHHALERGEGDQEDLLHRQGELQHHLDLRDPHTIRTRTDRLSSALGVPDSTRVVRKLSGGERRRTALCRTLLEDAELLLLDEPTNHLDAETLDWLEGYLSSLRGTVAFVTHDRYFLDNVATTMVELDRGRVRIYAGNYTDYLLTKEDEAALSERNEATRQNLMRREIDWLRRQPRARTTKSRSRIERANQLIADKPPAPDALVNLVIPSGPRLGNKIIEATNISHSIAGRQLIKDFTIAIGAGERIGIVGRNGLGKTTLLKILLQQLEPDAGTVVHGTSVQTVYADQERALLDLEKTVLEEVAGNLEYVAIGDQRIGFRSWLRSFLFTEETAAMPIRLLSGGERNRVLLAKMLRDGGNVIVMDEPTNDLDLPTLRILEEALVAFSGTALIVSHDRYFLNRIATSIIAFRGNGQVVTIQGNYDDYLTWLAKERSREARLTPPPTRDRETTSPAKPQQATKPKKLSYKEQIEYDSIEQRIHEAEERAAEIHKILEEPSTYVNRTGDDINKLLTQEKEARAEAERLVERWMELGERAS
jgi:ABC transport system ATP-binding/permease protein